MTVIAGHTDAGEAGVVVRAEGSWTLGGEYVRVRLDTTSPVKETLVNTNHLQW